MRRRHLEIVHVGRGRSRSRELAAILAAAGYQVSPARPGARPGKDGTAPIQLVIAEGLAPAELERPKGKPAVRSNRRRITVAAAAPMPSAAALRRSGSARKAKGKRQVSMTLRGLRESVGRTQGEVARRVAMTQPQLSRVETRRDHLISTLRRYVQALGGSLEIVAVVKGARVVLQQV
jgi:hypothetical protein